MLYKTRAVVLHSIKYGESGLVVQAYTELFGRQSMMVHGVRKSRSRINPHLFETLSIIDIELYKKENRELQNLKEARHSLQLPRIHSDIRRSAIAMFIGEILYRTLREEEANLSLFNYLYNVILILDLAEEKVENIPVIFLMEFTKYLGIFPKNHSELERYSAYNKEIALSKIMDHTLSDLNKVNISSGNRYQLIDLILRYYTDHLEGMGQIKSLPVLREVFH